MPDVLSVYYFDMHSCQAAVFFNSPVRTDCGFYTHEYFM